MPGENEGLRALLFATEEAPFLTVIVTCPGRKSWRHFSILALDLHRIASGYIKRGAFPSCPSTDMARSQAKPNTKRTRRQAQGETYSAHWIPLIDHFQASALRALKSHNNPFAGAHVCKKRDRKKQSILSHPLPQPTLLNHGYCGHREG